MEDTLATLIKVTATTELAIEAARHGIITLSSQHPERAFNLLDNNGSGYITVSEISGFLRNYGVEVADSDVRTMVKYYDTSNSKRLSTDDFIMAITPREETTAPKRREDRELDMALVRFFTRELELISKTRSYRHKIIDARNGLHEAFHCIDTRHKEYFSRSDLEAFLQSNHASLSNAELTAVFHRVDRNDSKKATLKEFQDYLVFEDSARPQPQQSAPKVTRPEVVRPEVTFSSFEPARQERQEKPKTAKKEEAPRPLSPRFESHDHHHHEHIPVTTSAYFPSYESKPTPLYESQSSAPKFKYTYYPPYRPNYFDNFPTQTSHSTYSHSHSATFSHSTSNTFRPYESTYVSPMRSSYVEPPTYHSTYVPKYTETYTPKYYSSTPSYDYSSPRHSTYSHYESHVSSPSIRRYVPYSSTYEPHYSSSSYAPYRSTYDYPSSRPSYY